jgi:hypothetical protein
MQQRFEEDYLAQFTQNRKIDLCIDIIYVNKCGFMTSIN